MNVVLIALCFLSAASIAFFRGAGPSFAFIYLPTLLLASPVRKLSLPWLPDANPAGAAIYGILLASLLAGRLPRLRATAVDYIVGLLICTYAISAITTVRPYRAVSVIGGMGMDFGFIPYFIVRVAFQEKAPPRQAVALLVATTFIVCVFALIEFRLWPDTYQDILRSLGLMDPPEFRDLMRRLAFMRATASFGHPIDLGIGAALVFALIAIFAWRVGLSLRKGWVLGGLALALIASFCGISFGAFMGLGCALLFYLALITFPRSQRRLRAAVALFILVGFALSSHLAVSPIGEAARGDATFSGSFRNRQQLIQNSWDTMKRAGFFGLGDYLPDEVVRGRSFKSVDNAYLLITMTRGWVALGLWLALPIFLAILAARGVRKARSRRQVRLILLGFSAVVGTMIAMYTVWFGFLYPILFMIVLAFTVNESQAAIRATPPSRKRALAAQSVGGATLARAQDPRGRRSVLIEQEASPASSSKGSAASTPRGRQQPHGEGQVVDEVATHQAAGLLHQAVEPLEPHALHPRGRALDLAAHEAQAHAHANPPRPRQRGVQRRDHPILLGRTQRHVHEIRPRPLDDGT